jgi:hypothetical protein
MVCSGLTQTREHLFPLPKGDINIEQGMHLELAERAERLNVPNPPCAFVQARFPAFALMAPAS